MTFFKLIIFSTLFCSLTVLAKPKYGKKTQALKDKAPAQSKFLMPTAKEELFTLGKFTEKAEFNINAPIDIIVWNIYNGVKPKWRETYADFTKNRDLILVQEFNLKEEMKQVFSTTEGLGYTCATAFIETEGHTLTGVATASKVKPKDTYVLRGLSREPIVDSSKITLFSEFNVVGLKEKLLVVNVHAITFVRSKYLFDQLDGIANVFTHHKGPLIVAGDFNTWKLTHIKYLDKIIKKNNLTEVTFEKDIRIHTFNEKLDHIFVRGFDIKKSEVLLSFAGSDHNAMTATLMFKKSNND